ncbi:ABC transporter ATP-binding protein [Propionimicrobium sp. PCR01-08-3]|uniref:ABC transporter ATP-binding protein n=1 Tax=Propionimicrobium sp. PCR01-08-3 TaxID=3052086 RepID=UPI00255C718F|nr:ABC transporter ATP-binding protein [Propionimicrobium sp. PCR01-08-3]WIY83586.1 ABC transporter ATP-binding protein [Propionimicrobium sp. PCR01-08-3]
MGESVEPHIHGRGLTLAYDERVVSNDLTVEIPHGEVTIIVGPNACGKSTLLRAMSRLLVPKQGAVMLDGKAVNTLGVKDFARRLGLLPQQSHAPYGITVGDLAARGRYPHQKLLQQWSYDDEAAVRHALEACGVLELADRPVEELSGGQRQRVWIALLLAQDPPTMLLDEPTTYLDIANQLEVLELVRQLNQDKHRTMVLVLHDLMLAARYADHMIVMADGKIVATGEVSEVLTEDLLADVFKIRAQISTDPATGRPLVIPLSSLRPQHTFQPVGSNEASVRR